MASQIQTFSRPSTMQVAVSISHNKLPEESPLIHILLWFYFPTISEEIQTFWSHVREYALYAAWTLRVRAGVQPAILFSNHQSKPIDFRRFFSRIFGSCGFCKLLVSKSSEIKCIILWGLEEHKTAVASKQKQLCTKHTKLWKAGLLADCFFFSLSRNHGHLGGADIPWSLQVTVPSNAGRPALAERQQQKLRVLHCCQNWF